MSAVLYVSYDPALSPAGESALVPLVERLAARGHRLALLTWEREDRSAEDARLRLAARLERAGIAWRAERRRGGMRPAAIALAFLAGGAAARVASLPGTALVHARGHLAGALALRLAGREGRPRLLFDLPAFAVDEYLESGRLEPGSLAVRLARRWERRLLAVADHVVVPTRAAREQLVASALGEPVAPERVSVIPPGVDLERFRPGAQADAAARRLVAAGRPALLLLGAGGPRHLTGEALDFCRAVQALEPKARVLVLARRGAGVVHAAAAVRGLGPELLRVARLRHEQMPGLLGLGAAGLLFHRPTFSETARSPHHAGELLACGVPLVATAGTGDLDALVTERRVGVIVRAFTGAALDAAAASLLELLEDPGLAARCRDAAREHYDLERRADAYAALYARLGASAA